MFIKANIYELEQKYQLYRGRHINSYNIRDTLWKEPLINGQMVFTILKDKMSWLILSYFFFNRPPPYNKRPTWKTHLKGQILNIIDDSRDVHHPH